MTPALSEDQAPFFDPAVRDEPHIREALAAIRSKADPRTNTPRARLEAIVRLGNPALSAGKIVA